MSRKLKTGVFSSIILGLFVPYITLAHATPVLFTPDASATETTTPSSISIRFTERIEVGASSLTVYGPDGKEVQEGKGNLDQQDERILAVPIRDEGEGVYTVSWQVVSVDDGHFTKGGYSFLVDKSGKVFEGGDGKVEISYSSHIEEAVASFFNLLGESLLVAVFTCLLGMTIAARKKINVAYLGSLLSPLSFFAVLMFCLGSAISIVRKTIELSTLQSTSFIEALQVYLSSSVGTFSWLKLLCIAMFFALFMWTRKQMGSGKSRFTLVLLGALLCAVLCMQAYISHAAASLFHPYLAIALTFLHLFAKELVIGSVALALAAYLFFLRKGALEIFSRTTALLDAIIAVALLIAGTTGAYITWLHLKATDNLFLTEWGSLFIYLIAATFVFGALRLLHQFVLFPRLEKTSVQKALLVSLPIEVAFALCVLFFSGYISMTTPPFTVESFGYEQMLASEGLTFIVDVHPYEHDSMRIQIKDSATDAPVDPQALTVMAENTALDIGPNVLPLQKRFNGGYAFPRHDLSPSGIWDVTLIARQQEGYDAHATFQINNPDDLYATKRSDDIRVFDAFAQAHIGVSIGIILFAVLLFGHAYTRFRTAKVTQKQIPAVGNSLLYLGIGSICAVCALCAFFLAQTMFVESSFERLCKADGHMWVQAFPTQEFMQTSPNAQLGCTVHDGHYHFVDQREYQYFKTQQ